MNFPIFEVPKIGGGMLIAVIAILHVFVSQFAIGGGLFLVWTERKARRENNPELLEFVKRHSRVFLLLTVVFGALSGVGIWFVIGLVHPSSTSLLIHAFVWGWAIEWVFFLVELSAIFIYYYTWDRVDARTHMKIGWIYFITSWLTLAVINGILSFMLTPGNWIATHGFADGILNPSYFPSLFLRTFLCVGLAGLYAMVVAAWSAPSDFRDSLLRYSAKWLVPAFLALPVGAVWLMAMMPEQARQLIMGGSPVISLFFGLGLVLSLVVFVFTYFGPFRSPRQFSFSSGLLLLFLGLLVVGTTEMVREAVRKPYVIYDYMYSNSIIVGKEDTVSAAGILKTAKWSQINEVTLGNEIAAGHEVFRVGCQSCHTVDGFNGVKGLTVGWDVDFTDYQLANLNTLKGVMPPFVGTPVERRALAEWIVSLNDSERGEQASLAGGATPSVKEMMPDPDLLPLPAPDWLFKVLLVFTFILHIVPMGFLLGGSIIAFVTSALGRSRNNDNCRRLAGTLARALPVSTAAAVTLGVAPLLFVQVLYGQLFFTTSIMMGWPWLAVPFLVMLGYYCHYYNLLRRGGTEAPSVCVGFISALIFTLVGFLLSRNAILNLHPEKWGAYFTSGSGFFLDLGFWQAIPRYLHFFVASIALGGVLVLLSGLFARKKDPEYGAWAVRTGALWFLVPTLLQLISGPLFLFSLPSEVWRLFVGGNGLYTAVFALAVLFALLTIVVMLLGIAQRNNLKAIVIGLVPLLLTLVLMSVTRHLVREAHLVDYVNTSAMEVETQLVVFIIFAVLLVAGLGTIGYMLRSVLKVKTI